MQTLDHDQVIVTMDASPDEVYGLVSDVIRTPEFSPEILSCEWIDGATGPAVGARFKATNTANPKRPSWNNTPVVTVADAGREFAFSRTEPFAGTVAWRYLLEADGDGTRVTESYTVVKPISRFGWFVIERIFGNPDRHGDLRAGMEETLRRVTAAVESGRSVGSDSSAAR